MQRMFLVHLRLGGRIMKKYDLEETGWQDVDWVHLALDSGNLSKVFDKETSLLVPINERDFFIE